MTTQKTSYKVTNYYTLGNGVVELIDVYGTYYGRVRDIDTGGEWDVMLNRLKPISDGQ